MKKFSLIIILLTSIIITGCISREGTFSIISTRNIDWNRITEYQRSNQRIEGEDQAHIIIFIPTKSDITIAGAVDQALAKVPGAVALVDAVVSSKMFYIPYIYGQAAYIVEGSVLIDPKLVAIDETNESIYYQGYYDKNKNFQIVKLEKKDFDRIHKKAID